MRLPPRQMHLNAFLMSSGHHEAAWRLPESDPCASFDLRHWTALARIAEAGTLDSVFLADGPALWPGAEFRPTGRFEPTLILTALSQATSHIGLIATASTTYDEPYNLARRFSTLDHLSGGRAGWNIVTTADRLAAQNFGLDDRPAHGERYARAAEFVEVALKLWDSWEEASVLGDKASGRYADVAGMHPIDHRGAFFDVRGPLNIPRSPQGHPLLVQAGSSEDGREFAARYAEAIFTAQQTLADAQEFAADLRRRADRVGRDGRMLKVLPGVVPIVGATEAEAKALAAELEELIVPAYGVSQLAAVLEMPADLFELDRPLPEDLPGIESIQGAQSRARLIVELARRERLTVRELLGRLGSGRGHWTVVGSPEQVADALQGWFEGGAADGFNVMPAVLPSGLEVFVEHVVPLLRRRGLARSEYEGRTLREHYGLAHPTSRYSRPALRARSPVGRTAPQ